MISYLAVVTADSAEIDAIVEGATATTPLEVDALYELLTTKTRLYGRRHATLKWRGPGGAHVYVDLRATFVRVTQSSTGGDAVIDVLIDVIGVLTDAGLNVWDPQQRRWFPGSPALR